MVAGRRGSTLLLVLALVTVGGTILLLVTSDAGKEFGRSLNPLPPQNQPQPSTSSSTASSSSGIQIRRTLQEVGQALQTKKCWNGAPLVYGEYCVLSPYGHELRNTSKVGSVTLCTQGTVEFLQHVVVLCHRWSGPISVAVYSPQQDYQDASVLVQLLRQCDSCVRYWVNWHFLLPWQAEMPSAEQFPPMLWDCSAIGKMKKPEKRKSQGVYPINVARNVARQMAATPFVFSSDIELYPSLDIPAKFERMLRLQAPGLDINQVWVMPVFEVQSKVRAPFVKSQLRLLYAKRQAISFHQHRCNMCHRIPNLTQWINHVEGSVSEMEESLEPMRVWTTVKRSRRYKLHSWEPFFIGTTKDPEFDIRLSWEGKQNKMQMAYEMCMRDYDFHIIENAFLVHSPGINFYNATKEKDRHKYMAHNNRVIRMVKHDLIKQYGSKKGC